MKRATAAGTSTNGTSNGNVGPAPTISRRRGVGGSGGGSINMKTAWKSPLLVLAGIAIGLTIGMFLLFVLYALPSTNATTKKYIQNSHIVQKLPGVPNLLRGKQHENIIPLVKTPTKERRDTGTAAANNDKKAEDNNLTINVKKYDTPPTEPYPYSLDPVTEGYTIEKDYVVKGGQRFTEYTTGGTPYIVSTQQILDASNAQARSRREYVKKSMQFVWGNYVKYAFGNDELEPISGHGSNGWGGHGITLIDALDTLWLMGMKDEFYQARDWVRDHLDYSNVGSISVFETTIRDLGGLLSAYDWSGDKVFLEKALDLGQRLLKSFDGASTGIPFGQVSLSTGHSNNIGWAGGSAILSEFGTMQIEFQYLASATDRPDLAEKTLKVFDIMNDVAPANGLYPYFYSNNNGDKPRPVNRHLTFGAMADSFYEYMLKLWLLTDKENPMYRAMYDKAMDGMHAELLQTSTPSGLSYIADKDGDSIDHKMDHLVCFMGGLLALGAYTNPDGLESERAQRDLRTGKALTYTCYQMYARMKTGISAEFVQFESGRDFVIGRGAPHYLLRPEAVESLFILNYLTGDPVYREWGWEIYQSIEKYCKTQYGYGSLDTVQDTNRRPRDKMESFFLAETLKYLYLLQDPDTEVDILRTHVFNTEAHPMRIISKMPKPVTITTAKE